MDVGNQAYQDAGIAHVVAMAKAAGFDGVFLDDANASLRWVVAGGSAASVSYTTDAAWQAAVYSFFTRVAPQLHAAGLEVVANIGGSTITPGLWQKWNTPLDGAMEESWTDGGEGLGQQVPDWSTKLENIAWSEANGKYAILNSYNTTEAGNTYGLASMLLVAGGWSSYDTAELEVSERDVVPGVRHRRAAGRTLWRVHGAAGRGVSPRLRERCGAGQSEHEPRGRRRPGRDVLRVGSDGRVQRVAGGDQRRHPAALRVRFKPDPAKHLAADAQADGFVCQAVQYRPRPQRSSVPGPVWTTADRGRGAPARSVGIHRSQPRPCWSQRHAAGLDMELSRRARGSSPPLPVHRPRQRYWIDSLPGQRPRGHGVGRMVDVAADQPEAGAALGYPAGSG